MKHCIAWHQECFNNLKSHLKRTREEFAQIRQRHEAEILRLETDVDFYERQINQAISKKKDGFDKDLFMKEYGKKGK
jgi:hypothetical protein